MTTVEGGVAAPILTRGVPERIPAAARPYGQPHVDSYWAATADQEARFGERLDRDLDVEVAIVGGGYTGLSTAYHLARDHGVTAHVLEANRAGWGCSGRNGGFGMIGLGKDGYRRWIDRYGAEGARRVFDLGREAVRTLKDIMDREGIDARSREEGWLNLAHKPARFAEMRETQRLLRETFDFDTELLGPDEVKRRYLDSRESYGALLYPECVAVHPLRWAQGLARAAVRQGARIHEETPVQGWAKEGGVHVLRTPRGTVRARRVVIATNGYTPDDLHPAVRGRLLPVLSNIVVTRPLTDAERAACSWQTRLMITDSRNLLFYYRQLEDGRVMFGARGGIEDDPASNRQQLLWMKRRLGEMFPALAGIEHTHFWRGWVCLARDRNPHVGTAPDDPSVLYALAYAGTGVAASALSGRLLAERLVKGGAFPPLLDEPLPRIEIPALRRVVQRLAYTYYWIKDEWL